MKPGIPMPQKLKCQLTIYLEVYFGKAMMIAGQMTLPIGKP